MGPAKRVVAAALRRKERLLIGISKLEVEVSAENRFESATPANSAKAASKEERYTTRLETQSRQPLTG